MDIHKEIRKRKEHLHKVIENEKHLSSEDVLKVSQDLDKLICDYYLPDAVDKKDPCKKPCKKR